jgi:NADPH:quinone reductase-like Zn-dependent oxidoreductase
VAKVGSNVTNVKVGDRVLGLAGSFLTGKNEHAAFQTYTIVADYAVSNIPDAMSFKAAATLPQGASTTIHTLFDSLGLPMPTGESFTEAIPSLSPYVLLVWGASSSVGFLNVQIARMIGLTVYAVASPAHHEKLRSVGAAEVFDYHSPTVADDIVAAAERIGKMISYASDAISEAHTIAPVMKVLAKVPRQKKLAHTGPFWPTDEPHVDGIATIHPSGEDILDRRVDLCAWLFKSALPKWLEDGAIEPLQQHVVEGGISGIQAALNRLKGGVHMEKVVVEL